MLIKKNTVKNCFEIRYYRAIENKTGKAIVGLRKTSHGKLTDRWFDSATRRSSSSYSRYLSRTRPSLHVRKIRRIVYFT